jgi:hypothetical protein
MNPLCEKRALHMSGSNPATTPRSGRPLNRRRLQLDNSNSSTSHRRVFGDRQGTQQNIGQTTRTTHIASTALRAALEVNGEAPGNWPAATLVTGHPMTMQTLQRGFWPTAMHLFGRWCGHLGWRN